MRLRDQARVTTTAVAAAVVVACAGAAISVWAHHADGRSLVAPTLSAAVVVSFATMGAIVASARPANRVGWLMLAGALLWALGNASVDAAVRGIVADPGSVPAASALAIAGSATRSLGWFVATVGVALHFPDGRLARQRRRFGARAFVAAILASSIGACTASDANLTDLGSWSNPLALPSSLQPLSGLLSLAGVALGTVATLGAVLALRTRWRRGGQVEQQQLTLFAAAAALPVAAAPFALAGVAGGWLFSVAALPLPFAIAFAVLARGLYDLRTAVNRTLVWGTLSGVVVGVYALVIAGLGGLLDASGAGWLPWIAAGVVALLFAPLRDALQRAVNRLSFGRWDEPYDVLAAIGQQLEAAADVDGLLADVVAELHGLGLQEVTIRDADGRTLAGDAQALHRSDTLPLTAYGQTVGSLSYGSAPGLRARDHRLLDDLAGHLGGLLHSYQLTHELQRALERLVLSREEERRRIRRDLHDGLGPALAGHVLRLDLIAAALDPRSPVSADVETLRADMRGTVLEVRRVVEGLRPPALDELGLAGALRQITQRMTAGTGLVVEVEVALLPQLPAAMEVATFRIVAEAVANVARHAHASSCHVVIEAAGGSLRATIADDGRGLPSAPPAGGHGLQTMRERAEELRGRLHVLSAGGTTIVAEIPLPAGTVPAAERVAELES
jgi:signal transduction histidine kinase